MLSQGSNIDWPGENGMPLRFAITKYSEPLMRFLLDCGANPNASVRALSDTPTVIHWAATRARGTTLDEFECRSSMSNMLDLIAAGADTSEISGNGKKPAELLSHELPAVYKNVFRLPLHAAIEIDRPDLCTKLLERGFNPDDKNPRRQTAFSHAKLSSPACLGVMQSRLASKAVESMLSIANTGKQTAKI